MENCYHSGVMCRYINVYGSTTTFEGTKPKDGRSPLNVTSFWCNPVVGGEWVKRAYHILQISKKKNKKIKNKSKDKKKQN